MFWVGTMGAYGAPTQMDESDEDSDEAASGTDVADGDFEEKNKVW